MKTVRPLLLLSLIGVAVFLVGLSITQSAPPSQTTGALAAPPTGQTAYEFVAQIDQSNLDLTIYGYLTDISGLSSDALFTKDTNPAQRGESSAFFTLQATGKIYARSVLQSIFDTNADLTLTVYYNETPGAAFDKPASFAAGVPVAVYDVSLQNILNVQSPDVGIANSNGDSVQTASTPFTFNGQQMTFGQVGLAQHMNAFGQGFRQSQVPLAVRLLTAGNAISVASVK